MICAADFRDSSDQTPPLRLSQIVFRLQYQPVLQTPDLQFARRPVVTDHRTCIVQRSTEGFELKLHTRFQRLSSVKKVICIAIFYSQIKKKHEKPMIKHNDKDKPSILYISNNTVLCTDQNY